ncbi:MAG: preprotein translocase subunit SecA [Lentisphaerae bacterium]|nr:preprotein translocase subunit SecA [Lentisphaerota bacterium]
MQAVLKAFLRTKNERDLRSLGKIVTQINALDEQYGGLSDDQLRAKTDDLRRRVQESLRKEPLASLLLELKQRVSRAIDEKEKLRVKRGIGAAYHSVLDPVLPEAFAVVKNACRRLEGTRFEVCGHEMTWNMVPFDVQLVGGIVLHQGKIAEMATGEGKTLVATMPLYLNALAGRNVHLVTTNDYLARRDSQWMGLVYRFLGVSVGCIQNQMHAEERRQQYGCDITYGTNSEFGFDYLRDNGLAGAPEDQVQRGYNYAIIDEVDSILIDEARTPLIISGPAPVSSHQYFELKPKVERLVREQRALCSRFIQEAKEHLEKDEVEDAQLHLYQVKHGMPKNKQLLHMIEDPKVRKLLEQVDNQMLTDMRKEQARALREEMLFTIDERGHDASLTEKGCSALNPSDPETYVLPDLITAMADLDADARLSPQERLRRKQEIQTQFAEKSERIHNVDQLIRAYCIYEKDVEYVVQNNQVLIVDEFTGRILPGRRWSDGLHQAVEAKEGVKIERETQTLATITIQNYFRMYDKLAGMTGTAITEADEFHHIYGLDVVQLETHRPVRRLEANDVIYKTQREKYNAIIEEVAERHGRGQPILIGTASVDTSEVISRMLRRAGIPHNVLNAKNHEREAEIVMLAGQPGAVTIATNMAGRGTDIKLGPGVVHVERKLVESGLRLDDRVNGDRLRDLLAKDPCGLHVIGSERHEARRIDRQLRGRCARQGDPGSSRFYVSLEDDLMRLFGSDRIAGIMSRLGLEDGQQLEHRWLNRSIETAQRRVEQQNFGIRRRTLEYDDVTNRQREVIYGFRGEIVRAASVREQVYDLLRDVIATQAGAIGAPDDADAAAAFVEWVQSSFPVALRADEVRARAGDPEALAAEVFGRVKAAYELKIASEDAQRITSLERHLLLHAIDSHWQDYLRSMDSLREGVGLRAYGQRDPLIEYKREAFDMFETLMSDIKQDVASSLFRSATSLEAFEQFLRALPRRAVHEEASAMDAALARAGGLPPGGPAAGPRLAAAGGPPPEPVRRDAPKVGRNDPCPCGSGKKYKKCHGASA